jgi:hypothetical protein
MGIIIDIPLRVVSEANAHEHWRARQKRAKQQRFIAYALVGRHFKYLPSFPVTVKFTRLAPRKLDSDNLAGACKAARDGVADVYGIDDGDERWGWEYGQEKAKQYGIRIEITSKEA